jgi:hypothetical protein
MFPASHLPNRHAAAGGARHGTSARRRRRSRTARKTCWIPATGKGGKGNGTVVIKEGEGFRVNGVFRWRASAGKEGWGRPKTTWNPAGPTAPGEEGRRGGHATEVMWRSRSSCGPHVVVALARFPRPQSNTPTEPRTWRITLARLYLIYFL